MLSEGVGCVKNDIEAVRYYGRAATLESAVGSFYFGRWLTKKNDHVRAYSFYQRGAERDHLPSLFRVGYSLARGKGISVNLSQAYRSFKWLPEKATPMLCVNWPYMT
jgi:uncharacterized protein